MLALERRGCGASRDAPVSATLPYTARVGKEDDDTSLEPLQLKRLGLSAYDDFFTAFEESINKAIYLNNALQDALWNVKAALSYASSFDSDYALQLELTTQSVRSMPQLLLDITHADSVTRPSSLEVRHLLNSRPATAEADRAIAAAVHYLSKALQAQAATAPVAATAIRLSYDDAKQQLLVTGVGAASLQQPAARLSTALAQLRTAAPGLRVAVTVVPTAAPGVSTFAWRLVPRSRTEVLNNGTGGGGGSGGGGSGGGSPASGSEGGSAAEHHPPAGPLAVAAAPCAAALLEAATTVAQQAAAVAAAISAVIATCAPPIQLQTQGSRRLLCVPAPPSLATPPATLTKGLLGMSFTRMPLLTLAKGAATAAAAAAPPPTGITAAAQADEAVAVLRRTIASANHALFRLFKCTVIARAPNAPSTGGGDALSNHSQPIARALKLVIEAAMQALRQTAAAAASSIAVDESPGVGTSNTGATGNPMGQIEGATSLVPLASELLSVDPRLILLTSATSSEQNGNLAAWGGGGGAPPGGQDGGGGCDGGGGGGSGCGGESFAGWSWSWGVESRVAGVEFPSCLPPKARALYDTVCTALAAGRDVSEALPDLRREVEEQVAASERVFAEHDEELVAAGSDMMTAGRLRAALDRNANTLGAAPTLLGMPQAGLTRLMDELRRGAEDMRTALYDNNSIAASSGAQIPLTMPSPRSGRGSATAAAVRRGVSDSVVVVSGGGRRDESSNGPVSVVEEGPEAAAADGKTAEGDRAGEGEGQYEGSATGGRGLLAAGKCDSVAATIATGGGGGGAGGGAGVAVGGDAAVRGGTSEDGVNPEGDMAGAGAVSRRVLLPPLPPVGASFTGSPLPAAAAEA